jgi:MFS family permease
LLAAQAAAFVFFSAVIPIEVVFAKDTLGAGDTGYGFLLGSWGVGMVIGSIVFAALRRAPLPVLLFFSTLAVGAGYLGTGAAQTLAFACVASAVGGAGNGVQWVAVMSAVQELTVPRMQARVIGVLESIASATPGLGYVLGGLIATGLDPRATFFVAGAGVVATVAIAAPLLGTRWPTAGGEEEGAEKSAIPTPGETMLELIPGGRSAAAEGENSSQPNPEVRR